MLILYISNKVIRMIILNVITPIMKYSLLLVSGRTLSTNRYRKFETPRAQPQQIKPEPPSQSSSGQQLLQKMCIYLSIGRGDIGCYSTFIYIFHTKGIINASLLFKHIIEFCRDREFKNFFSVEGFIINFCILIEYHQNLSMDVNTNNTMVSQ